MRACFLECLRVNAYGKEFYGMHMLEGETEQSFVLADRERERKWMCVLVWPCRSALEWVYFTKRVWVYVSPLCIAQCVCLESERDRYIERESPQSLMSKTN